MITERPMRITMDIENYFKIADSDRSYAEKLIEYERLADKHFETTKFEDFRAKYLTDLDEAMWDLVQSQEFDNILVQTVQSAFPHHERDHFIAHFRGLLQHWAASEAR